jgi:hypothetical protein
MRSRLLFFFALMSFATAGFSKDVYLSIAGTVNNFHTDARIFNPSATKEITVTATFYPNDNNTAPPPSVDLKVGKRAQKVYDDAVTSIFGASGLGAIKLHSDDDFVATSRIYAIVSNGTLGQFCPGLDAAAALKNGVLIQAKSTGSPYRTNIGAANPSATAANVTWRLYDKDNNLIGAAKTDTIQPNKGLLTNITGYFGTGGTDLTDAWISFTSDQPIFAYISVLDNGTTDPTFITASPDTGAGAASGTKKVFSVTTHNFAIDINPTPSDLAIGDVVEFDIVGRDTIHGFEVLGPDGVLYVPDTHIEPNKAPIIRTFTVVKEGTYLYTCTITTCGTGHGDMAGTFDVGAGSDKPPRPGY